MCDVSPNARGVGAVVYEKAYTRIIQGEREGAGCSQILPKGLAQPHT